MQFPITNTTTLETQENSQEEAVHENKIKTINNIQVNLKFFKSSLLSFQFLMMSRCWQTCVIICAINLDPKHVIRLENNRSRLILVLNKINFRNDW